MKQPQKLLNGVHSSNERPGSKPPSIIAGSSVGSTDLSRKLELLHLRAQLSLTPRAAAPEPTVGRTQGQQRNSAETIVQSLREESIEDGVPHPAEALLAGHLSRHGERDLVSSFLGNQPHDSSLLRLFGRSMQISPSGRQRLVSLALKSNDIQLRDAAVQAVENWSDQGLADLLRQHNEPVQWLADYKSNVLADLKD